MRVEACICDQVVDKGHVVANFLGSRLAGGGEPDGAADLGGEVAGCFPAQPIGEEAACSFANAPFKSPRAWVGTVVV